MIPFSVYEALKEHWPDAPDDKDLVEQKIFEATLEVKANFPGIERRMEDGSLDRDVVKLVVNRMVKRALDVGDIPVGASSVSTAAGPFTQSVSFSSANDGNLYLSAAERRMLRAGTGKGFGSTRVRFGGF